MVSQLVCPSFGQFESSRSQGWTPWTNSRESQFPSAEGPLKGSLKQTKGILGDLAKNIVAAFIPLDHLTFFGIFRRFLDSKNVSSLRKLLHSASL